MFDLSRTITPDTRIVAGKSPEKSQPILSIAIYAEVDGVGLGQLTDGSVYVTQRGLARLCGVQNAHIGTISRDWNTDKPRIQAIKARLAVPLRNPHSVLVWQGHRQHGYHMAMAEAVLDYYALDAGDYIQPEAQENRLRFKREPLGDYILKHVAPKPEIAPQKPLRFLPLRRNEPDVHGTVDAMVIYICGLYAVSIWMANTYFEGLKQRAMNAPWNRLGLYLPLKAVLEIQAEAILRLNGTFNVR